MRTISAVATAGLALVAVACALNPEPGKPAIGMDLPCFPKAVAAGEGAVWVVPETDGESVVSNYYWLTKIDPQTGRTLNVAEPELDVLTHPVLTTGFGAVWLAIGRHLTKIDPATGKSLSSVELSPPASSFNVFDGIAAGLGAVWATRVVLFRVDPTTGQVVATIRLPRKAGQVAIGADAVWVATPDGISRIDPDTNREVLSIPLNLAGGRRIVFAAGSVWVFDSRGGLARLDPRTNQPVNSPGIDSVTDVIPNDDTSVWILQRARPGYRLLDVDIQTNRIRTEHPVGNWNSQEPLTADAAERASWLCVDGHLRRLLLPRSPNQLDYEFSSESN